mmetsp:Transcript_43318/g.136896  ORF Transcript_43318/g.136896 Transcript_43318/m.136896 type:complete len:418 (-) Transcript_43318:13-1266(-)
MTLLVPRRKMCHLPEQAKVDLRWIIQQIVLVLSTHRQDVERIPLYLLHNPSFLDLPSLTKRHPLNNQHVVCGVPVDVTEVQLGYPKRKQVLATHVRQELWSIVVPIARDLHPVRLPAFRLVVVPWELREELGVQIWVRLLILQSDEGLVAGAASGVKPRMRQLLNFHDPLHAVVLGQGAEFMEGRGVPTGAKSLKLLRVLRILRATKVPGQTFDGHLAHLSWSEPLMRRQLLLGSPLLQPRWNDRCIEVRGRDRRLVSVGLQLPSGLLYPRRLLALASNNCGSASGSANGRGSGSASISGRCGGNSIATRGDRAASSSAAGGAAGSGRARHLAKGRSSLLTRGVLGSCRRAPKLAVEGLLMLLGRPELPSYEGRQHNSSEASEAATAAPNRLFRGAGHGESRRAQRASTGGGGDMTN